MGVDISRPALLAATEYARTVGADANFVLADARFLRFRDASFSFSWSAGVLEHIDELSEFAREAHRTLRNGGNLLVIVPSKDNLLVKLRNGLGRLTGSFFSFQEYWGEAHVIEHPPAAVVESLRRAGLTGLTVRQLALELFIEYAVVSRRPGRPTEVG